LATAELKHAAAERVVGLGGEPRKALDLFLADGLLPGHQPVQAVQPQPLEKVGPGQELDADVAQVGGWLPDPLQEYGAALGRQVVDLARRAACAIICKVGKLFR
jgi:hypothetical protein